MIRYLNDRLSNILFKQRAKFLVRGTSRLQRRDTLFGRRCTRPTGIELEIYSNRTIEHRVDNARIEHSNDWRARMRNVTRWPSNRVTEHDRTEPDSNERDRTHRRVRADDTRYENRGKLDVCPRKSTVYVLAHTPCFLRIRGTCDRNSGLNSFVSRSREFQNGISLEFSCTHLGQLVNRSLCFYYRLSVQHCCFWQAYCNIRRNFSCKSEETRIVSCRSWIVNLRLSKSTFRQPSRLTIRCPQILLKIVFYGSRKFIRW